LTSFFPEVARGTYLIVRCDGTEELMRDMPTAEKLCRAIGADTLDTVILTWIGTPGRSPPDLIMSVDDRGYETEVIDHDRNHIELRPVHARLPVNERATLWYWAICLPGTTHQIVGDVVIARDQDFAKDQS
jgi:hypothetical protein